MAIQYTPSLGLPYPEVTDAPLIASRDLRALAQKMDSEGAQMKGESVSALTAAQAAEALAAQALARAEKVEFPIESGTTPPEDEDKLWVDEGADGGGTVVTSEDISDATSVGRNVLTAPLAINARNALDIWTGTRALLDAGTDTAERTWDAAELAGYVTDQVAAGGGAASWDDLTGKPTTFPPSAHTHQIGDVDGLGTRLAIVGAGRPDVAGSMIGSVASAVAAAPSGTIFVSTDGPQGAWQWQKLGTAWTVTFGILAPRDIPFIDGTILTTRPGISTTISRTGDRVMLSIVNVLAVSSGPFSQAQQRIPAGFRPAQEFNGLLTKGSAEQHARLLVQTSGNVIVASASAINGACAATASWVTTDPWPTTLPGDPA